MTASDLRFPSLQTLPTFCRSWISFLLGVCFSTFLVAQEDSPLVVKGVSDSSKIIPIALDGFSGEAQSVLAFDLEVQGFEIVDQEKAQFIVQGSSTPNVQGKVIDRITQSTLLSLRAYRTGTTREQAHAFAEDILYGLTRRKGIGFTKIAFTHKQGPNSELTLSDFDGHHPIAITQDKSLVMAPAWVPGKLSLYYTSYRNGNPDIFAMDLTTGRWWSVFSFPGLNSGVAVSPNGKHVAVILSKSGNPELFVAEADGKNLKQLTNSPEIESSPTWSPDGTQICFSSRMEGSARLYTLPLQGGKPQRIQTVGVFNAYEPDWSPDGNSILFTTQRSGEVFDICLVPAKGGTVEILTRGEDPSWAPNSRTAIITSRRGPGKRVLSLLDVPTKRVKDIQHPISGSYSQPSWAK